MRLFSIHCTAISMYRRLVRFLLPLGGNQCSTDLLVFSMLIPSASHLSMLMLASEMLVRGSNPVDRERVEESG
jgi:hypothetical protein